MRFDDTTAPGVGEVAVLPLSFGQELLWSIERAAPGSSAYNVPRTWRLTGEVDPNALRAAFTGLVARHEILRTTYDSRDDEPVQIVHAPTSVDVRTVDLRGGDPEAVAAETQRLVREWGRTPFDLAHEFPLRVALIRVADREYVLHVDMHHIASDGGSRDILLRDLDALYGAAARGEEPRLPELPIQYGDYADWERRTLAGERLEGLLAYWRRELDGAPFALDVPTDFPRPAVAVDDAVTSTVALDAAFADAVRALARRFDATPYVVVLAAYTALLHRYGGQSDVLVGSPVAGRAQPETEGLIGYFSSMVVQRARFASDPTAAQLIAQLRESTLAAYEHRDIPFDKLVLELEAGGDFGRSPIFQAVLTMLEGDGGGDARIGGLETRPFRTGIDSTKFDLTLFMRERSDGLTLSLRARSSLWTRASVERFVRHLRALLTAFAGDPSQRVGEVPLLDRDEQQQLAMWNATAVDVGPPVTMHALIEATAARVPSRTAVIAGDEALSYGELDARAAALGSRLRARGAGPGSRVGILLDRGAGALVAVLGVLKSGAAYVPLLPDTPAPRIAQQLGQAGVVLTITLAAHAALLPDACAAVLLDGDSAQDGGAPSSSAGADPGALAYVLFTSGSTGVPKGVAVTHRNIVHYARAISRVLGDVAADAAGDGFGVLDGWQFGMVSTLAADLGYTALFPALCAGGTLHLIGGETSTDPQRFRAYLAAHPLDVVKITPGHLRALAPERVGEVLPRRWLVLGGEALSLELAQALCGADACRVLNHYGPTETTVGACSYAVTAESIATARAAGAQTVPIGMPLANVRAYVVDSRGLDVPAGVHGELCIGGDGVSDGYVGRPDLTAERFIERTGAGIVYRTGDRVRRLAGGALEFLGRIDDQVKIRGYRVEPGEVEALLAADPALAHAAVRAWGEGSDVFLAAYVVFAPGTGSSTDEVRARLASRLPDYLVPRTIVELAEMPRTANGKIDRRALPAVDQPQAASAGAAGPRTPTEAALVEIWTEAFKRAPGTVGIHDDFLALGGHSLLAIRVLGKVKRRFDVRLALRALFDAPTIAELAEVIDLESQLAALEAMSEEEAVRLLGVDAPGPAETGHS